MTDLGLAGALVAAFSVYELGTSIADPAGAAASLICHTGAL
jgi:hypothetical protein